MSTITLDHSFVSGIPIDGIINIPLLEVSNEFSLSIGTSNSSFRFNGFLINDPVIESDRFVAEFELDANVIIILTLIGNRTDDGTKFQSGRFHLNYKITKQRPRAHFIASTFMAVCGLAGKIEIRELVKRELKFNLPLLDISKLLQRRQMAYRLMVIEEATGKEFLLPHTISGGDADTINFVYHAIVDRSFIWHGGRMENSIPATQEWLTLFPQSNQPFIFPYVDNSFNETIFGQSIMLGPAKIIIEDAVVQHYDEVRRELARLDGHFVSVSIQSFSGQVRYEFEGASHLPNAAWDSKIQALIDMEAQLDDALTERYHALAASTVEGLTEEEKLAITARPELDEQAFLS